MNVKEIISKYLLDNGYDGLFNSDTECGCLSDDDYPCEGEIGNCEPGYKLPGKDEYDWLVGPKKEGET